MHKQLYVGSRDSNDCCTKACVPASSTTVLIVQPVGDLHIHCGMREVLVITGRGAANQRPACKSWHKIRCLSSQAEECQRREASQAAAAFQEALAAQQKMTGGQEGRLGSLRRQLAADLADVSPHSQATAPASPGPSHRQTHPTAAAPTQQDAARLKGLSSQSTHAQRSSGSRSVTSHPNDSAPKTEPADVSEQATQAAVEVLNQDTDTGGALPLEDNKPIAAERRTKLPQIAEASAERIDSLPAQQHISFMNGAFKDNQVTLETPSLFPGSHQQPNDHVQDSTAAGSEEMLRESDAQLPNQNGIAVHTAVQEAVASGSPTANRENVPLNHSAPFSQSQGKPRQALQDAGGSLKLSLQGAGGQAGPERYGDEFDDME